MEMRVSDALCSLVAFTLPEFTEGKLLYVLVDSRLDYFNKGVRVRGGMYQDLSESCAIHFLFQRRTNYTQVAYCVNHGWRFPNLEEFNYGADHDSCWRSDGVDRTVAEEYFRMADAINSKLTEKVAPIAMSHWNHFKTIKMFNGSMKTIRPSGDGCYRFDIKLTEE